MTGQLSSEEVGGLGEEKSRPVQVVHYLAPSMRHGGVQVWLMRVLRHIDRNRYRFTFCVPSTEPGSFDEEVRSLGSNVVPCSLDAGARAFVKRFLSVLTEVRCDVLHVHTLFFAGWLLKLGARAGVPIRIAHAHTTSDERATSPRRRLYRWLMRRYIRKYATHGIGCSAAAADYVFTPKWRTWPGYQTTPCAIDLSEFQGSEERATLCEDLQLPGDAMIIGHVGRFRYAKNHAFLIRIAAAMMRKQENVHLLLVGDGELMAETEALARELGIAGHVTFAGARNDVPVLMKSLFELFLFPSRYEGLGVVVVEAQCAGVPSLVSDAVPAEAALIEELVHWESLRASPEVWADRALDILNRPPYDKEQALEAIERSPFGISAGVRFLSDLYTGRITPHGC